MNFCSDVLQFAIFSFKAWEGEKGEEKILGLVIITQKHTLQSTGLSCTGNTAKPGSNESFYECIKLLINYFYHSFYALQLKLWPLKTVISMTAAAKSLCSKVMDNRRKKENDPDTDCRRPWLKKKNKNNYNCYK